MIEMRKICNIAVIGLGNLGLRHLQSLSEYRKPANIYIIDTSETSLNSGRLFINTIKNVNIKFLFSNNINDLPNYLDFVVISTNSDIRLHVIKKLLVKCKVTYLLLEKVLFQKPEEYYECSEILIKNNVNTYVNCPMRTYEVFKSIKIFFKNDLIRLMTINGGEWGLACNSIHYIDLFSYLVDEIPSNFTTYLDKQIYASKRNNFIEFNGNISAKTTSAKLDINSCFLGLPNKMISIIGTKKYCTYDEQNGSVQMYKENNLIHNYKFSAPYQSALTLSIFESLLNTEKCELIKFCDSVELHLPFINTLIEHMQNNISKDINSVKIT